MERCAVPWHSTPTYPCLIQNRMIFALNGFWALLQGHGGGGGSVVVVVVVRLDSLSWQCGMVEVRPILWW